MGEASRDDAIEPQIPHAELRRALEEQLHRTIPPLLGGLLVLYAFLTVATPLIHPPMRGRQDLHAAMLVGGQVSIWLTFAALAIVYRRGWVPASRAHLVGFLIAALPLLDSLAHLLAGREPIETLSCVLVMLGAAITFTSWRPFYALLALAGGAWTAAAVAVLPGRTVEMLMFVVVEGLVLAAVAFHMRMRTLSRLESVRWVSEHRGARLDAQNQRLRELDRLKSEFVNAVSHDLRTPLTSIKGYTEFLEDGIGGELNPEQRGYVQQIDRGTRRLERLVNDLLDFARLEAGTFRLRLQEHDVRGRITEIADSLRPHFLEAGLTLELALPATPATAWIDPQRIEQVLANLLTNAAKFTPAGGAVRVTLRVEEAGLRCEVADTGCGIGPVEMPQLFQRFSQLHAGREKGGTGLGLSISKAIVEAHGGQIGAESEPDVGSTFWFTLPVAGAASATGDAAGTARPDAVARQGG
ncbi:Alkaline phosphatase synthesis sensor protein PhoR [compost metagenome]